MKRIQQVFSRGGRKALIAYLTMGYPDIRTTVEAVPALVDAGCDMVELGIPFSDPLADGATIQRAAQAALAGGVTPQRCLEVAGLIRRQVEAPLLFMTYYNPILHYQATEKEESRGVQPLWREHWGCPPDTKSLPPSWPGREPEGWTKSISARCYGIESFCRECQSAGVDGLIVPDLPPEEGEALEEAARSSALALVYLLSPSSTPQRVRLVAAHSQGFIYLVSLKGVTGARNDLPEGLEEFVGRVRKVTDKPLCVGFGIATPHQAKRVAAVSDGVIIGSRLVEMLANDGITATAAFVREVRRALDG